MKRSIKVEIVNLLVLFSRTSILRIWSTYIKYNYILAGNMWGQDWSPLLPLLLQDEINLDERILKKNWTVHDMVCIKYKLHYHNFCFSGFTRRRYVCVVGFT